MIRSSKEVCGIQTFENLHTSYRQQNIRTAMANAVHNPHESYIAASLSKLYIGAATLSLVEGAEVALDHKVNITPQEYLEGNYGTGRLRWALKPRLWIAQARHSPVVASCTVGSLLKDSISHSDNLATLKIVNFIGRDRIQTILGKWGLDETTIFDAQNNQENKTTANDMGDFLYDLADRLLLGDALTERMVGWMKEKRRVNSEGKPITLIYKEGRAHQEGCSYSHIAGYIQGTREAHLFVILTKDKVLGEKEATFPQQSRLQEILDQMVTEVA